MMILTTIIVITIAVAVGVHGDAVREQGQSAGLQCVQREENIHHRQLLLLLLLLTVTIVAVAISLPQISDEVVIVVVVDKS